MCIRDRHQLLYAEEYHDRTCGTVWRWQIHDCEPSGAAVGCEIRQKMWIRDRDFPSDIFSVEVEPFRGFKEELRSLL